MSELQESRLFSACSKSDIKTPDPESLKEAPTLSDFTLFSL